MSSKIALVCASLKMFNRIHKEPTRYFYVSTAEDIQGYDGEVVLEGTYWIHPEWKKIDDILKERCKNNLIKVVKI